MVKNNLSIMLGQDNPFLGLIFEVNEATAGFLAYCMLLLIFIVASYVMMRRTQDIAKSFIGGLHITTILSILLFYMGKLGGYVLIPNLLMLALLVGESIAVALLYYQRMKGL
jgi:uncharacterized membrane protein YhaH (DUF805 family)